MRSCDGFVDVPAPRNDPPSLQKNPSLRKIFLIFCALLPCGCGTTPDSAGAPAPQDATVPDRAPT